MKQIVFATFFTEGVPLDVSALPHGVYMVQLIDNQRLSVQKRFVKM